MSILSPQDNASVKEPPIPVVVHSQKDTLGFRNEDLDTPSISDLNRIMEREDNLHRAYSEHTQKEKRQFDQNGSLDSEMRDDIDRHINRSCR
jgi:hypothetical protein